MLDHLTGVPSFTGQPVFAYVFKFRILIAPSALGTCAMHGAAVERALSYL